MNYRSTYKRVMDIVFASSLFVLTLPIFAVTSVLVLVSMGRPIFFIQKRTGLNAKVFSMIKFRTMVESESGSDSERTTRIGRFLRRTSIDELPELLNIVKGDMSLVGPRPLLPEYIGAYSPEEMRRHCVKPGLTGLAQISGRNGLSWEEKFRFDIEYVDSISMATDLKILLGTLGALTSGIDADTEQGITMERLDKLRDRTNS